MTNKFRIGEIVIVNGKAKNSDKNVKALGIIECKDYYYNDYLITLLSSNEKDWFNEKKW